ncbi:Uncharacterized membrane protein [Clostridium collagenovorans DSM 3089]|uniref:Uncharacterized membrane protein n=1 Tax=Clostridium collagenovorans DSM 3089 TaxID=1121306 RepID=A0A1M5X7T9_9CLOT|nr:DUF1700 domain-containing protein [Clostridium collagenovorans]SHH95836.1 Uncharacterized membrane protein [Clostridium collagenovorans DSM 3089]
MRKENFIRELEHRIRRLPRDEVRNIIAYYEDYFADADKPEEEVIRELGNPSTISSQILSDYAFNDDFVKDKKGVGKNKVILTILAVFAAPIALPLGIAALAILFALGIVIFALVMSFVVVAAAFGISGIAILVAGIMVVFQGTATAIFYMGIGIVLIGIGILAFEGIRTLVPRIRLFTNGVMRVFLDKVNKRGRS